MCIVGGGPVGATIALELQGFGASVVILEAGGEGDMTSADRDLYRGESTGLPYYALDRCRTRALGGSGACWGGFCRIWDAHDFEPRDTIPHSGWPLTLDELLPYHERAHVRAALGPVAYDMAHWQPKDASLTDPFAGGPITVDVFQRSPVDGDHDRSALSGAADVTVVPGATVLSLDADPQAERVESLRVHRDGHGELRVRARHVVLAAGGIENARLLLLSDGVRPGGLGNDHDLVGRFFMDHLNIDVGTFDAADETFHERCFEWWHDADGVEVKTAAVVDPAIRRSEGLLRTFFELSPQPFAHRHGRKSLKHMRQQLRNRQPVGDAAFHVRNVWTDRAALLDSFVGNRLPGLARRLGREGPPSQRLLLSTEPAPDPRSRVMLSDQRDALGLRRVRLDWQVDPLGFDHAARCVEIFADDVHERGLGTVEVTPRDRWSLYGHNHHVGTTRMADDPTQGVVDRHCRVHSIENLHVAGSSVFPTAGSGTVTLLGMVLAIRLADRLRELV